MWPTIIPEIPTASMNKGNAMLIAQKFSFKSNVQQDESGRHLALAVIKNNKGQENQYILK